MTHIVRMTALCLVTSVALLVPFGAPAGAGEPIRAGQHFVGLVNGRHTNAIVKTACAGPGTTARTGPVAGRQTMSARRDRKGKGDTGPFDSVSAWFQPTSARAAPVQLRFRSYDVPKVIPTSVVVPCSGSGTVVFSSCPYLAPCAAGWVTDDVEVSFVDVAD